MVHPTGQTTEDDEEFVSVTAKKKQSSLRNESCNNRLKATVITVVAIRTHDKQNY